MIPKEVPAGNEIKKILSRLLIKFCSSLASNKEMNDEINKAVQEIETVIQER